MTLLRYLCYTDTLCGIAITNVSFMTASFPSLSPRGPWVGFHPAFVSHVQMASASCLPRRTTLAHVPVRSLLCWASAEDKEKHKVIVLIHASSLSPFTIRQHRHMRGMKFFARTKLSQVTNFRHCNEDKEPTDILSDRTYRRPVYNIPASSSLVSLRHIIAYLPTLSLASTPPVHAFPSPPHNHTAQ
jgi:hypothetical protein